MVESINTMEEPYNLFERYFNINPWRNAADGIQWAQDLIDGKKTKYDLAIPLGQGHDDIWFDAMMNELIRQARRTPP